MKAVRANDHARAEAHPGGDDRVGLDADALAHDGIGRDDGGGMDARLVPDGRRGEEGGDFSEGGAGRLDHDAGEGEPRRILGADEDGGGAA